MKILNAIIGFFKNLFGKKVNGDGDCDNCNSKDVCQTIDRTKKFAVIVGMENSKWGSCPGSNKDSNVMLGLVSQYTDNIVKLNNGTGTVAAVENALRDQIRQVPEDGLFIFTYSGHGGQYSKSSSAKNETDGKDEFLCLYDGALIDNKLWEIMNECKGRVVCIYDCCHSGTMYRLPHEIEEGDEAEDRLPLERPFFAKYENVRAGIKMLVISGCGEETVSWGDSVNGGVLTAAMKKNFNKCLTYKEWWNRFKAESTFKKVKQVPICTRIGGFDLNATIFN